MPNASSIFAWFGLLSTVLAIRSYRHEQDPTGQSCPTAKTRKGSQNIFEISASAFKDANLWQEWRLYRHPNCSEEAGPATILPRLDQKDPVKKSEVFISIEDSVKGDVYLCSSEATSCVAEIRPEEERWALVDLFKDVLSQAITKGFHSLRPEIAILFELMILFAFCVSVAIIFWSASLIIETWQEHQQRRWGLLSNLDVSSKHLQLPSPSEVISQAFIDVLFFVIGCGLFVLEGERFFRIYQDHEGIGFVLVIAFPLLFGCAALMRIFLAASRCILYYESLRSGILLKLQPVTLLRDPWLLWFYLGVIITVANAFKVLYLDGGISTDDIKASVVFVSPLYYMTSSLVDIQYAETIAVRQHCTLSLKGISKDAPVELGADDSILPMEESTFVKLSRQRKEIQPQNATEEQESRLTVFDFQWVGFVSLQRAEGLNRALLRLFNPSLICALLCLGLVSFVVSFKTMIAKPHLLDLRIIGGGLSKGFNPSLTEYGLMAHSSQHIMGVAAKVNPSETSLLTFRTTPIMQREVTTTTGLAEAISLDQDIYPTEVKLEVQDTFRETDYRMHVFKYGILPESITFSGEHANGQLFHRCIPWGFLASCQQVWIPKWLKTLDISIKYAHFVVDLPTETRQPDRFTTFYEKNVSKEYCLQKPHLDKQVAITQFAGEGCFSVVQPKWTSCGTTRSDFTEAFLKQVSANVEGAICVRGDVHNSGISDCKSLETSSSSRLFRNLTNEDNEGENETPWWEESRLELQLLLSYKDSKKKDSSQLVIMDSRSYTSQSQGIELTTVPRETGAMFQISMFSGTSEVMKLQNWHEVKDYFFEVDGGGMLRTPGKYRFFLEDLPHWTSAEFLEIVAVSDDLDCHLSSLQVHGQELQISDTASSTFCTLLKNNESQACGGWRPTRTFLFPMELFKERMTYLLKKHESTLTLTGKPTCTSLTNFQDATHLDDAKVSIKLSEKSNIKVIPWIPAKQVVKHDAYLGGKLVELDVINGNELQKASSELLVTFISDEINCTMENFTSLGSTKAKLTFREISEEACSRNNLSTTESCGGSQQSVTVALPWDQKSDIGLYSGSTLLYRQIDFTFVCKNRIWNPFPIIVDITVYPDEAGLNNLGLGSGPKARAEFWDDAWDYYVK